MSRTFTANVALNEPGKGVRVFKIGEDVPEWATVGDHVTQGVTKAAQTPVTPDPNNDPGDDDEAEAESYSDWTKAELRTEVDGRELEVEAKANKAELIAALEADDLANPED